MSKESLPLKEDEDILDKHVKFDFTQDMKNSHYDEETTSIHGDNIENEIDDALDEGYMGMQCTLERGYSLSEWSQGADTRWEHYCDNMLTYNHNSYSYYKAAKDIFSFRKYNKTDLVTNVDNVGLLSYISCSWLTPLTQKAFKSTINFEDLFFPSSYDMCEFNTDRLEYYWNEQLKNKGPDDNVFLKSVWRFFRTRFFFALLFSLLKTVIKFFRITIIMRAIILWIPSEEPLYVGVYLALLLLFLEILWTIFSNIDWLIAIRTSIRLRAACYGIVYRKILRLSSLDDKIAGEVFNIFTSDAMRLYYLGIFQHQIFIEPLILIFTMVYTLWWLSSWALLGVLLLPLLYPLQYLCTHLIGQYRKQAAKNTDERLHLITEIITYIKLIKMHSWEDIFNNKIKDVREKEKESFEKLFYVDFSAISIANSFPMAVGVATFLIHTAAGNGLTAAQAFPFLALMIGPVRQALSLLHYSSHSIAEGLAALKRIQGILLLEEIEPYIIETPSSEVAVEVVNASFSHTKPVDDTNVKTGMEKHGQYKEISSDDIIVNNENSHTSQDFKVLLNISLKINRATLTGICGRVASGKSSLLQGLLNQLVLLDGTVAIRGSVSYVSQQPWILESTIRENILLQEHFNPKEYYKVIDACSLSQDIASFPEGDLTIIGEHGATLSGGQKQRISLARAIYSNKAIYLLDDPLSAVDANVCQHVFHNAIKKALRGKTVLLVSHHFQYFPHCHQVILLSGGHILEMGTHNELISLGGEYADLYKGKINVTHLSDKSMIDAGSPALPEVMNDKKFTDHKTTSDASLKGLQRRKETIERDSIPFSVYVAYIQNAGGFFICTLVMLAYIMTASSSAFSAWWLSYWLYESSHLNYTDADGLNSTVEGMEDITQHPQFEFYRLVYGLSIVIILLASLLQGCALTKVFLRASTNILRKVFYKLLRSPCHYFDVTPSGQIINLFSKDADEVDAGLGRDLNSFLKNLSMVFTSFLMVSLVFPYFLIPLLFIGVAFFFLWRIFRICSRELKRLDNVSKSPVLSHLNTTIRGLSSISAYKKQELFFKRFVFLFDENNNAFFLHCVSNRWLAFRFDSLVVVIVMCTLLFALFLRRYVDASFIGLALAYSFQLTGLFRYFVLLATQIEARFISVQRLINTAKDLISEAPLSIEANRPEAAWPTSGRISFNEVRLKYYFDAPLALKGISFEINSQEKIGIVGRTGSGKSSLGIALLRLVEISDGHITIDGIDITRIGLKDLRFALSIVPQDPVLFSGTIRFNLDPSSNHSDDELWYALENVYMKDTVNSFKEGLQTQVQINGENFSVGERHLICLARAFLKKSKVIFLDEATAGIDNETDKKIQKALQQAFKNCTIITVAHRIDTVMQSSKILVMSDGKVAEFDSPSNLMARDSLFSQFVKSSECGSAPN